MIGQTEREALVAAARAVVAYAYWVPPPFATRDPRIETEFVAALIANSVDPLARAWGDILEGVAWTVQVTGAFLHQRPYVRFPIPDDAAGCELADFLLVLDRMGATRSRRAVLIQAKRSDGPAPSGDQERLYVSWEPFRIRRSQNVIPPTYSIAPNEHGGRYGVVQVPRSPTSTPWSVADPLGRDCEEDLGAFLGAMLTAAIQPDSEAVPKGRPATPGGSDDWSKLIDSVLAASFDATFRMKGYYGGRMPRVVQSGPATSFLMLSEDGWTSRASRGRVPPLPRAPDDFDGEPIGMNFLHIEVAPID